MVAGTMKERFSRTSFWKSGSFSMACQSASEIWRSCAPTVPPLAGGVVLAMGDASTGGTTQFRVGRITIAQDTHGERDQSNSFLQRRVRCEGERRSLLQCTNLQAIIPDSKHSRQCSAASLLKSVPP